MVTMCPSVSHESPQIKKKNERTLFLEGQQSTKTVVYLLSEYAKRIRVSPDIFISLFCFPVDHTARRPLLLQVPESCPDLKISYQILQVRFSFTATSDEQDVLRAEVYERWHFWGPLPRETHLSSNVNSPPTTHIYTNAQPFFRSPRDKERREVRGDYEAIGRGVKLHTLWTLATPKSIFAHILEAKLKASCYQTVNKCNHATVAATAGTGEGAKGQTKGFLSRKVKC